MAHLTLAGLSADGKRLLLVGDHGDEHTLDIDATLRAALRGEHARIGQLEIHMDSALRPRDIQNRIRAGESPEDVARAANTTVEKILAFSGPVMAERAHIADRAQTSSLRRPAGDTGARTLGEAVAAHLRSLNVDPAGVEWDAWRREDGKWTLTGTYSSAKRKGVATFAFDLRGNFVTSEDDDARWLVGDTVSRPAAPASRDDLQHARERRLGVVADEVPLGDDALEMVSGAPAATDPEPLGAPAPVESPRDTAPAEPEHAPAEPADDAADAADRPAEEPAAQDPAPEPPPRKPARKGRGRASVPSWDEIMFGGGNSD